MATPAVLPVRIGANLDPLAPGRHAPHPRARQTVDGGGMRADLRVESVDGELVEMIEGIELAHLDDAIVASDVAADEASWLYSVEWAELRKPEGAPAAPPARAPDGRDKPAAGWSWPTGKASARRSASGSARPGSDAVV